MRVSTFQEVFEVGFELRRLIESFCVRPGFAGGDSMRHVELLMFDILFHLLKLWGFDSLEVRFNCRDTLF